MKKLTIIIAIIAINMASCKKQAENPTEIRNKIIKYESEIVKLNKKIDKLNDKLNNDSTVANEILKVKIQKAKPRAYEHYVEVTANVDAVQNAQISPQLNGQITKIFVKEGQHVRKGQLLIKLNDEVQKHNLAQLETRLALADTLFQKQKKLYQQNIISEVKYLESKNQKESLEKNIATLKSQISMSKITAPFSGIVDQIFVKEGELAMPGRPVLLLVNMSKMQAVGEVSEKYLPIIKIGDKVFLTFQTYPNIKIKSKINFIGNVIDPVNRTFRIKVKFNNIDNKIKPNMLSVIHFKDFVAKNAFVVKTQILAKDIKGWYLFIVNKNNIVEKRYVKIGTADQNYTVIKKGLNENDKIIVEGYNLVKNGMKVQIVNTEK
jgi:RND family efflux transporter MFP subunit